MAGGGGAAAACCCSPASVSAAAASASAGCVLRALLMSCAAASRPTLWSMCLWVCEWSHTAVTLSHRYTRSNHTLIQAACVNPGLTVVQCSRVRCRAAGPLCLVHKGFSATEQTLHSTQHP